MEKSDPEGLAVGVLPGWEREPLTSTVRALEPGAPSARSGLWWCSCPVRVDTWGGC